MATRSSHSHRSKSTGTKGRRKVYKVMKEHKQGKLKYGSGKKAKSRKQAVAIALSEARRQREMILSKSRGTSATTELAGFGSSFRMAESVESFESPWKARLPVSIS